MPMTRATADPILTPEQVYDLLVQPVEAMSAATRLARVVSISSSQLRVPLVTADPTAQWVAEGDEITPSDPTLDEDTVTPSKVAGLTIVSRELANDSSPEAAEVVGRGLARDIARRVDEAFFGALPAPAPAGLGSVVGVTAVAAPTDWVDVDPFVEAIYAAEGVGATVTGWAAHPDDALALSTLKESTGSNRPVLGPDPSEPGRRQIAGVPLLTSPSVTPGTVWGIAGDSVLVVVREDTEIETDRSVFFTSDRVAVRGIMRVGFGFPHPASVVRITRAVV